MSGMETLVDILSWILIVAGSLFAVVGAAGILRFPDFWSRLHALSITDSGGVILLLLGMALQAGWGLVAVKLLIILAFLFITGPTATHAVANAALVSGMKPKDSAGAPGDVADPESPESGTDKAGAP